MRRASCAVFAALLLAASSLASPAEATPPEPWSDPDPPAPPERHPLGEDYGFRGAAEYRAQSVWVQPVSLNTTTDRNLEYLDQRLRLDGTFDYRDLVKLTASADVLESVLWGNNGTLGQDPEPTSGAHVNTNNPNFATPCIVLQGGNPADPRSYGYGLCPADPIFVRRVYGDVMTPVGLLRVGRQPFTIGAGVAVNDGDGRHNRFGVAGKGNSADRVLFATKPLEAFRPAALRDRSEDRGLVLALMYDRLVTGDPQLYGDNLHNWITFVRYLAPSYAWGRDLELRLFHAYRWESDVDTSVHAVGGRVSSRFGDFYAGMDWAVVLGQTREVSQAFSLLTNDPPVDQTIQQFGARAVVRYDRPKWTAYLEADYASGDSDPSARSALTQFKFAEDTSVGLLLFKQVLAFQTGRAAAAGSALLKSLGAASVPVEAVDTHGAFTNAFALFPQADYRPLPDVLLRGGVLFAWAPAAVNDPIASVQHRDGVRTADQLVNFAGGRPAKYYGTELDGRVQWRLYDHFAFDLEGAILFPGAALADENGDAVRSVLVQGRTTFFF
ncbi:MAG TPA: hypothetical protein VIF15_04765 [Polyangiaceae bacterium]|jgi:hypothetical protein